MIYILEDEDFAKLKAISTRLHAGTDRERDEGHKLWVMWNKLEDFAMPDDALSELHVRIDKLEALHKEDVRQLDKLSEAENRIIKLEAALRTIAEDPCDNSYTRWARKHLEN